jgi:predicted transporter
MSRAANRPILIRQIHLWWYAVALVPVVLLGWLSLSGILPGIVAPLCLFAFIFWLTSFIFALVRKLRRPRPESRK